MPEIFVQDEDFTLWHGDAIECLKEMKSDSVDCIVTSPPYFGLRDYGTGTWEGGDPACEHSVGGQVQDSKAPGAITTGQRPGVDASTCRKCGAHRIDKQIGLEQTPEAYIEKMVEVFREARRVLAAHGTVWINIGASYNSNPAGKNPGGFQGEQMRSNDEYDEAQTRHVAGERAPGLGKSKTTSFKPKDLIPIPWMLGMALQADGWWLRMDVIWAKPNPLPESITDRPTKSHEYVLMLSKNAHYFFDQEAVREPAEWNRWGKQTNDKYEGTQTSAGWIKSRSKFELEMKKRKSYPAGGIGGNRGGEHIEGGSGGMPSAHEGGRNIRSVWTINTQAYAEAHFAVFPEELAQKAIAAGCAEQVCTECGTPRLRDEQGHIRDCHGLLNFRRGVVLDPFMGSGTTALVARKLGRHSVGIELNGSYCQLIADRLQQLSLFA